MINRTTRILKITLRRVSRACKKHPDYTLLQNNHNKRQSLLNSIQSLRHSELSNDLKREISSMLYKDLEEKN